MESHDIITCQVPSQMCLRPLTNRPSTLPICFSQFFDAPFILKVTYELKNSAQIDISHSLFLLFIYSETKKKSNYRFRSIVLTHQYQTPEFPIIPRSHQHYFLLFKCCFHCCHSLKRSKGLLGYSNLFPMNG